MTTAEGELASSGEIGLEGALLYRDGLIIALLSVVPLRRRTLAAARGGVEADLTGSLGALIASPGG